MSAMIKDENFSILLFTKKYYFIGLIAITLWMGNFWSCLITMCLTLMVLRQKQNDTVSADGILVQDKIILTTFFKTKRYFVVVRPTTNNLTVQDHNDKDITEEMEPFLGFNNDFFNQTNNITVSIVNDILKTNFESIKVCGKDGFSYKLNVK